jgi:hypothetical protein
MSIKIYKLMLQKSLSIKVQLLHLETRPKLSSGIANLKEQKG